MTKKYESDAARDKDTAMTRGSAAATATATGVDVRGILYIAVFCALIYANYTLMRPYVLLFVNAALVSTALRPVKDKCLLLLESLADGENGRNPSMIEQLIGWARRGSPSVFRRSPSALGAAAADHLFGMNTSTAFLIGSLSVPVALAAASATLNEYTSGAIAYVISVSTAVLCAAAAGLLLVYLVDRKIFWYRAFISDDAMISVCLVSGIIVLAAAIVLVLAIGGLMDAVYIVTSSTTAVKGFVGSSGINLEQVHELLEQMNVTQYAGNYGILIDASGAGSAAAAAPGEAECAATDAMTVSLGSVYGFSTKVDVGRLADGIGINATESPLFVSAVQSAAGYVSSIQEFARGDASGASASTGGPSSFPAHLSGLSSLTASEAADQVYRGAGVLASALPGLLSLATLRKALRMARTLLGTGLGRVIPVLSAVAGQSASIIAGVVDEIVFVSFTVEMLTVRHDVIGLIVDFLHPDEVGAAVLAEEIRGSIEDVIFFPLKLAATRCCCTLMVMAAIGARCVFLGAFIVTAAALVAPAAVAPTLLLVPWSLALVLVERRYLVAVGLPIVHSTLLNYLEDAILSTARGDRDSSRRAGKSQPIVNKPFHSTLLSLGTPK